MAQALADCPFQPGMLASNPVGSVVTNPPRTGVAEPDRRVAWLKSATAELWIKFLVALAGLGLAVSGFASTPWNIAVGGTDFFYQDYASGAPSAATLWNVTNDANNRK